MLPSGAGGRCAPTPGDGTMPQNPEGGGGHLDAVRREVARRNQGYRERALRLFPHVCASCGRTFEGRRLRELTVHHKDHNHDNNPPDGSNWELLCLYCHDHEHERGLASIGDWCGGATTDRSPSGTFQPLAGLDTWVDGDGDGGTSGRSGSGR